MKVLVYNKCFCVSSSSAFSLSLSPVSMAAWALPLLALFFCAALTFFFSGKPSQKRLPPGPRGLPLVGNLLLLRIKSLSDVGPILRQLRPIYGPIVTLRIGPRATVFITDHALAHQALVASGAAFADSPPASPAGRITSSNQHNISAAAYGPLWRLLRRNLMSETLHPSRVRSYAKARNWVLGVLLRKLVAESEKAGSVRVMESFQYAMFCLLLLMCFGQKLDEKLVRDIGEAQRQLLLNILRFNVLSVLPRIGKFLKSKKLNDLLAIRRRQAELLVPLIKARMEKQGDEEDDESSVFSYVDSLLELQLPEEGGRKLTEEEMMSLCSEFLNAGTDTTSTILQWVMANLVKHPEIQEKLAREIYSVMREREGGESSEFVGEEDLQKMKYLKAVVMETLRLHPPGHFVLPHAVKEEVEINGYVIPKDAMVNFAVAEMGRDKRVWEEPMEFRPERFLNAEETVDITGTREIKMMPFGAGRRICPGMGLAMLHMELFVANLVREFEWKAKEGEVVDLAEKEEFTVVMKKPLEAVIIPRKKTMPV